MIRDTYTTNPEAAADEARYDADPGDTGPTVRPHACYRTTDGKWEWEHCAQCFAELTDPDDFEPWADG